MSKLPPTIKIASIMKTLQIAIFSALKGIFILEDESVDVFFILKFMEVQVKIL